MERLMTASHSALLRHSRCTSCRLSSKTSGRVGRVGLQNSNRIQQRFKSDNSHEEEQARPLEGFYAELLNQPVKRIQPATGTIPLPPTPDQLPKTDKEERIAKARVVFGSRLAGPGLRQAELAAKSINIAGVLVPPKPTEPDNCCMSGCVNCVWDLYRDELEDWATKSAEARTRLQAQRHKSQAAGAILDKEPGRPSHVATSMDDDGGGSETNWSTGLATSGNEEDLFANIPVGIREFMRTEKRLKQQKLRLAGVG